MGISSGAALAAVNQKLARDARRQPRARFCYDTGERYLSVETLFPAQ